MRLDDVPDELGRGGAGEILRGRLLIDSLGQRGQHDFGGDAFFGADLAQRPVAAAAVVQLKVFEDANRGGVLEGDRAQRGCGIHDEEPPMI